MNALFVGLFLSLCATAQTIHYPVSYDTADSTVPASFKPTIKSVIERVDAKALPLDTASVPLLVKFLGQANNAGYVMGQDVLTTATAFTYYDEATKRAYSKALDSSLPIVAHEYGHYVLDMYMRKHSQPWRAMTAKMSELKRRNVQFDRRMKQAMQKTNALTVKYGTMKTEPEKAAILEEIRAARKEIDDLMQATFALVDEIQKLPLGSISLAYNELFADTVAVLAFEDGAVIRKLLWFPANPRPDRDFTTHLGTSGWNKTEAHVLLDPSRAYLWDAYLEANIHQRNHARFLTALLEAIRLEIEERVKTPALFDLSPREINERFIRRLERR